MTSLIQVGLIGDDIGPSLSPALHEREGALLGFDYRYRLFDLKLLGLPAEGVGELLDQARRDGFAGLNITHPAKQIVLPFLDEISFDAQRLGAVNTVVIQDGRLLGHNTDWVGFRDGVIDGLPGVALTDVVQFGGGGAGSASAYAVLALGTERLTITDLVPERVAALADRLRLAYPDREIGVTATADVGGVLAQADGVIHATPIGMVGHPGMAFDPASLRSDAWVADVVYFPIRTELLKRAQELGLRTLDGGRMNVGQAVEGIRLFTGVNPDAARMRAHFLELTGQSTGE